LRAMTRTAKSRIAHERAPADRAAGQAMRPKFNGSLIRRAAWPMLWGCSQWA